MWFLVAKESDLHTKRTGHTEFTDKTLEAAKPISLEAPKVAAESEDAGDESASKSEGIEQLLFVVIYYFTFHSSMKTEKCVSC